MAPKLLGTPETHSWDWHKLRAGGIGASEAAAALGLSPWVSPFSLYWTKVSEDVDHEPSEAMLWGTLLEPVIVDRFRDKHPEFHVLAGDGIYCDTERPHVRATPDGLLCQFGVSTTPIAVLEVKTSSVTDGWGESGGIDIPLHYWVQVQQQMHVMDVDTAWVAVLIRGRDYREYEIGRDRRWVDHTLLPALDLFWRSVERMEAPPVDAMDSTTNTLRALHPDVEDVEVQVPDDVAQEYIDALYAAKVAEQRKTLAQNRLLEAMGDARYAVTGDDNVRLATRIVSDRTSLDSKALKADHPDLYAQYQRTSRSASLRSLMKGTS